MESSTILADDKQIVIKKADKGSCVVIWDRDDYLAEAERQLKDENVYRNVNFNEKLIEDLTEYSNKIFKDIVQGQPVILNCGTPTEKASEFLDSQLKPIMQKSWSYIKDSGDFIDKIKGIRNIPENALQLQLTWLVYTRVFLIMLA